MYADMSDYWYRADLYNSFYDMIAPRIVLPERKIWATIPMSSGHIDNIGVPMDGFDSGPSATTGESLSQFSKYDVASGNFPRANTMKGRIDQAVIRAQAQLANAREAQAILERNPDLEKLLDIMQRGNF